MAKKTKLIYFFIAISVALSVFAVRVPIAWNLSSITLYASAIAGYGGVMLMLWSMVLGTRSVTSFLSKDFAEIIKIHSWIGKYGTLLIFAHPILISISYGKSLLYAIIPSLGSEFSNDVALGQSAVWILLIIWISSALLRGKMSHRPWKYLHFAAYIAIPFALLHIPNTGSSFASIIGARVYFLVVTIGFLIFALLRLRGALNFNKCRYRIIKQQPVVSDTYELILKPIGDRLDNIKPGQYIYIKTGWFSEDHPFSMCDYNPENGLIKLTYKVCGEFTEKLSNHSISKKVFLSGPFGEFTKEINESPVVYIAGGIGIVPFMNRLLHESKKREQWLFYVNKSQSLATYESQLKTIIGNKMISIYSRETMTTANTETGHLNEAIIQKYLNNPQQFSYYICGPQPMVAATVKVLKNIGVPKSNIHEELFSF